MVSQYSMGTNHTMHIPVLTDMRRTERFVLYPNIHFKWKGGLFVKVVVIIAVFPSDDLIRCGKVSN